MTSLLHIHFLGGFEFIYQNESIASKIPKRLQSLLAYLILHRGTPQARQRLAFLLWPDSSEKQARTNLRRSLHTLRQVFAETETFIAIETKSLQWRLETTCEIDIAVFEHTLHTPSASSSEALEAAIHLYNGPLLPNCYDEWIEPERERLHQLYLQAHTDLIRALQAQQHHHKVIRYAQQLIRLDPLSETTYALLMESFAASGDRNQAMQTYHHCMTTLQEELGLDPSPTLQELYQRLLQEPESLISRSATKPAPSSEITPSDTISPHCDWGNAPDVRLFYGRAHELTTLKQWIVADCCRVVMLLGMGGIGKTSLSVKLAQLLTEPGAADHIIWRSLRNAPSLETLLSDIVPLLLGHQETEPTLKHLMAGVRQSRCVLILDNFEAILLGEQRSSQYHPGYEAYGELLRLMGETHHQSCLILTSREKPQDLSALEGPDLPVRSLFLRGSPEAALTIVQSKNLTGTEQQQQALCEFYGHNLLALKIVTTSIQDLFDGNLSAFHTSDALRFNGIHQLLAKQCQRCTPLERTIMYWLAINREWTPISDLAQDIVPAVSRSALLEALKALMGRSLVEKQAGSYTQQPVVMEYVTAQLISQVCNDILAFRSASDVAPQASLLDSHALLKAEGCDYIRDIQIREILQPVLAELAGQCGHSASSEPCLRQALAGIQANPTRRSSYAAGNLLNLLSQICPTLENYDFSGLALRQADLRRVNLHHCNLQDTDLTHAVFLETLSLPLALTFSQDSTLLAIGDAKGDVHIWNVVDGCSVLTCSGHTDWIWSLSFSPDGNKVVSGSSDRTVKLWELDTGQCLQTLQVHTAQVWSVAFHPTEPLIASASEDQTINLWNINTDACQTLRGHTDWVRTVVFSPDGHLLASGSDDHTVRVWDSQTGDCCQSLSGHTGRVWDVAFAPHGTLGSSSSDRTIKLWNLQTGECVQTLEGHQNWVRSLAFSPDGETLASGSEDQTIKVWHIATGNCQQTLRDHQNWVRSVAFSPDGQYLASGSGDNTVKLWQPDGQCRKTLQGYIDRVWAVAFSPDSSGVSGILASANDDHHIKLWNLEDLSYRQTLSGHTNAVCAVAFHPQDPLLASGSEDHTVKLWELETGQCIRTFKGHLGRIWSVAFSHDGRLLASSSEDHSLKVWDVDTGQCQQTLNGHHNWVCATAFCPGNASLLASGSYDNTIKLWDLETGECLQTLTGHDNWVWSIAFSPTGDQLASGSGDHAIKLWDLSTGQCLNTLAGHSSRVWSVAFSADGNSLASASSDRTVKLWDIPTGACLKTLEGHTNLAWSVAFSADGQFLASGSQDETIRLWDRQTGDCRAILRGARPYQNTNILGAKGLTEAQRFSFKQLGAQERTADTGSPSSLGEPVSPSPSSPLPAVKSLDASQPATSSVDQTQERHDPPQPSLSRESSWPSINPLLIGRDTEWETIRAWAAQRFLTSVSTTTEVLLLQGEPGIGKTRLLEELAHTAQTRNIQTLWGAGLAAETMRPYGLWIDALRSQDVLTVETLPEALGELLPELRLPSTKLSDPSYLFDAVADTLTQWADSSPLLLLLDDIQWLDEASSNLLNYLIRVLRHRPVGIVCTARPAELSNNTAVAKVLHTLTREQQLRTLEIGPLLPPHTAALIESTGNITPSDLSFELMGQIFRDSGGNPLLVLELARSWDPTNKTYFSDIETFLVSRIQQLEDATQEILPWAAAMGRSFKASTLGQVTGHPIHPLLNAIEELERQFIIRPSHSLQGEIGYEFSHDILRQVVYQQLSQPRRQLIHRHIAHQLQELTAQADCLSNLSSEIAYHADRAADHGLATAAAIAAAEYGLKVFAYTEALEQAQQGIEHCQYLDGDLKYISHAQLLRACALAGVTGPQAEQVIDDAQALIQTTNALGFAEAEAIALEVLVILQFDRANFSEVHQHTLRAVEVSQMTDPATTAHTLAYSGTCLAEIGRDMHRAEAVLLEAQSLAERVKLKSIDITCGLGMVNRHYGRYEQARGRLQMAWKMSQAQQDHWRECICLNYLAMVELESGNSKDAIPYCDAIVEAATNLRGDGSEGAIATALKALAHYSSNPEETQLEDAIATLQTLDSKRMLAYVLTSAALVDLKHAQSEQAVTRAEQALALAQIVDHPSELAWAWTTLVAALLALPDRSRAIHAWETLQNHMDYPALSHYAQAAVDHVQAQLLPPVVSPLSNTEHFE